MEQKESQLNRTPSDHRRKQPSPQGMGQEREQPAREQEQQEELGSGL